MTPYKFDLAAVTDGYQNTVNYYRAAISKEYAEGVEEGRRLRREIRRPLADVYGNVTFASIMGFMKRFPNGKR